MAEATRLSWGLLGTARINRAVIPPIRASKKSELTAVGSRSLDRAAAYAKSWGIPQFFGSYEELLEDTGIDVIYNSLPNSLHAEWAIRAMQMGKHVLCEKPLTTNIEEMDEIIKAARITNRVIAEAFMYRHHPQTIKVKQMVDQGAIGNLQLIRGSFCYTNSRLDNPRLDPKLGGGSLWDVGCYPVSYARFLLEQEPTQVYGHQVTGPSGVDLFFAGQLDFPGDVIAQFDCSFISPHKAEMEILGSKGRMIIPEPFTPGKKTKFILEKNGHSEGISIKSADLYLGEIEDIENSILNGHSPRISLDDSRRNLLTLNALYESAKR